MAAAAASFDATRKYVETSQLGEVVTTTEFRGQPYIVGKLSLSASISKHSSGPKSSGYREKAL